MEEDFGLSANALAALKQFAQEQGVEMKKNEDGEDDVLQSIQKQFNTGEKQFTKFSYDFKDNKNKINVQLNGIEQEYGQTLQSTGLTLWRAAEDLSQYIFQNREEYQGKKIIELGAGLGLVGVLLGCINKTGLVNITDGDEENGQTLELLAKNVKDNNMLLNEQNMKIQRLWWGDKKEIQESLEAAQKFKKEEEQGYDYIFAADVVYHEDAVAPLIDTANQVLKNNQDARFYLAFARRNIPIDKVFQEADKYNFVYEEVQGFKCKLSEEHIFVFKRKI